MERFIPMEIFREKSNTFRGITFFPFLPKRSKFSVPFVWTTSARLHVQRRRKIYRYFVNGTTQSSSCFRCQRNASTIRREIFTEISAQMVSAPDLEQLVVYKGQCKRQEIELAKFCYGSVILSHRRQHGSSNEYLS